MTKKRLYIVVLLLGILVITIISGYALHHYKVKATNVETQKPSFASLRVPTETYLKAVKEYKSILGETRRDIKKKNISKKEASDIFNRSIKSYTLARELFDKSRDELNARRISDDKARHLNKAASLYRTVCDMMINIFNSIDKDRVPKYHLQEAMGMAEMADEYFEEYFNSLTSNENLHYTLLRARKKNDKNNMKLKIYKSSVKQLLTSYVNAQFAEEKDSPDRDMNKIDSLAMLYQNWLNEVPNPEFLISAIKSEEEKMSDLLTEIYALGCSEEEKSSDSCPRKVDKVLNNGTLVLEDKEMIKLLGVKYIQAPDSEKQRGLFQQEFLNYIKSKVDGKKIRLDFDKADKNRHGERVAYIYILNNGNDDIFLNADVVKQGYGETDTELPFRYLNIFQAYEHAAREQKRGLWK